MAWAPLILASICLFLIAVGVKTGGLKPRKYQLLMAAPDAQIGNGVRRLHGKLFQEGLLDMEVGLGLRNMPPLIAAAVLSTVILVAYAKSHIAYTATLTGDERWFVFVYALTYLGIVPVLVAAKWTSECLLLRVADLTVGIVQAHVRERFLGIWTRYEFRDQNDSFFGGTSHNYDKSESDSLILVFFNPNMPGFNVASCSLVFHRVSIKSTVTSEVQEGTPHVHSE